MTADSLVEPAPDYAEPLEGWRIWRVVERGGRLALGSVIKPTVWPAGAPLVAACLHTRLFGWWPRRRRAVHDAPAVACECGIYATALDRLPQYLGEALGGDAVGRVVGRVALWGTVVECERGLRASHAYPLELYVANDVHTIAGLRPRELAAGLAGYAVPVEVLDAREAEAVEALTRP